MLMWTCNNAMCVCTEYFYVTLCFFVLLLLRRTVNNKLSKYMLHYMATLIGIYLMFN